jgi:hypothetical protein
MLPSGVIGLSVLIAVAGICAQSMTFLNHDVAWVLHSSRRLLNGGVFGQDVVAANPPLIWWITAIPAFVAQTLGASPITVFRLFALAVAAVSLIATERLMRNIDLLPRAMFVLFAAFLFTVGLGRDFGQREMFAVMLSLPYLAAAASRIDRTPPPFWPALAIGAAAGVGIGLKPYFIAVPVLVEALLLWKLRDWRTVVRPEALAAVATAIAYAIAILAFARPWLSDVVPDVSRAYWAFSYSISETLPAYGLSAGLAAMLALTLLVTQRRAITLVLGMAALGFLAAALIQAKAYSYHLYPVTACLLLALATAVPARGADRDKLIASIAAIALVAVEAGNVRSLIHRSAIGDYGSATAELVKMVRKHVPAGGRFLAISTHPHPSFPVANYADREIASQRNSRIYLPAVVRLRTGAAPANPELLSFTEAQAHKAMRHDMALKPDIVIIDQHPVRHAIGSLPFDFLAFYKEDPAFLEAWSAYEKLELPHAGFAVYRRREGAKQ